MRSTIRGFRVGSGPKEVEHIGVSSVSSAIYNQGVQARIRLGSKPEEVEQISVLCYQCYQCYHLSYLHSDKAPAGVSLLQRARTTCIPTDTAAEEAPQQGAGRLRTCVIQGSNILHLPHLFCCRRSS